MQCIILDSFVLFLQYNTRLLRWDQTVKLYFCNSSTQPNTKNSTQHKKNQHNWTRAKIVHLLTPWVEESCKYKVETAFPICLMVPLRFDLKFLFYFPIIVRVISNLSPPNFQLLSSHFQPVSSHFQPVSSYFQPVSSYFLTWRLNQKFHPQSLATPDCIFC